MAENPEGMVACVRSRPRQRRLAHVFDEVEIVVTEAQRDPDCVYRFHRFGSSLLDKGIASHWLVERSGAESTGRRVSSVFHLHVRDRHLGSATAKASATEQCQRVTAPQHGLATVPQTAMIRMGQRG